MSADHNDLRAQLIAALKGAKIPTASLDPTSPVYDSADEAADAAFKRLDSSKDEQAGVFYRNAAGKYQYSIPTTQAKRDDFALKATPPKGYQLAGIFHTHPGDDDLGQVFSDRDITVAKQLKIPSYVQFLKTGQVRSFTPGVSKTYDMTPPGQRMTFRVADGDPLKLTQSTPAQLANALEQQ